MLNHIVIMGRLTRDPELRRTQSGIAVTTISVAVDRDYQSRDSQERQTDFIDVVAWRSTAEFISKYFTKGRMIVVEGSLQSRKWQDKAGQNRVSWEIQASNVYFGDSKRDNQGGSDYTAPAYGGGQSYGSPAESYTAPAGGGSFAEIEEDGELPF
ncbi:MAG: single-stranded DNA-binding protein [Oscillospiraceae bacterium]|nr:single-stranded DNA-binding protein [Oscillospiraceae bacterium]